MSYCAMKITDYEITSRKIVLRRAVTLKKIY